MYSQSCGGEEEEEEEGAKKVPGLCVFVRTPLESFASSLLFTAQLSFFFDELFSISLTQTHNLVDFAVYLTTEVQREKVQVERESTESEDDDDEEDKALY